MSAMLHSQAKMVSDRFLDELLISTRLYVKQYQADKANDEMLAAKQQANKHSQTSKLHTNKLHTNKPQANKPQPKKAA